MANPASVEKNQSKSKESNGARGGRRPGAGRKPGSATVKTREIANRESLAGLTPLEYMLDVMRRDSTHDDPKVEIARETMRFEAAKAAAPYIHARLSSVEMTADVAVTSIDAEINALRTLPAKDRRELLDKLQAAGLTH